MTTALQPGTILDCGHPVPARPTGTVSIGYAYAVDTGASACYPCAEASELAAFTRADVYLAYVDSKGDALTTWTGGHLARVIPRAGGVSRNGWHGSAIYAWRFRAEDGSEWYGRNGGLGMFITVRRAKGKTA